MACPLGGWFLGVRRKGAACCHVDGPRTRCSVKEAITRGSTSDPRDTWGLHQPGAQGRQAIGDGGTRGGGGGEELVFNGDSFCLEP